MTGTQWLPGATVVASSHDGGSMLGGEAYATWHSFENDPLKVSAVAGAKYLIASGNEVTLCFNPVSGAVAQILPAGRASRGLMNLAGGVQTNRAGRVNIQIEVVGYASKPWTGTLTVAGRQGLARILAWLDSWGIPRNTPAGEPAGANGPFNRIAPAAGGHYTHSQWKENTHWDHGAVRWEDIFAVLPTTKPVNVLPKPAPVVPKVPAPPANVYTRNDVVALQNALHISPADGKWGPGTEGIVQNFRNASYPSGPYDVRTVQRAVGAVPDGVVGPRTRAAIIAVTKTVQRVLKVTQDGDWGPATDRALNTFRSAWKGRY